MIFNPISVSPRNSAVVGVIRVNGVERGVVVAEDYVAQGAVAVAYVEVGDACCVGDELCCYAGGGEGVFSVGSWRGDGFEGEGADCEGKEGCD